MEDNGSTPMAAVFAAPGRYVQGRGAIHGLGETLRNLGSSKPLVLRDAVVAGLGQDHALGAEGLQGLG